MLNWSVLNSLLNQKGSDLKINVRCVTRYCLYAERASRFITIRKQVVIALERCWFSGTDMFSFEAHNSHIQANEETLSLKQSNFLTVTQRVNGKISIQNSICLGSAPGNLPIPPWCLTGSLSNTDKTLPHTCEEHKENVAAAKYRSSKMLWLSLNRLDGECRKQNIPGFPSTGSRTHALQHMQQCAQRQAHTNPHVHTHTE